MELIEKILGLKKKNEIFAVASVVETSGSTPGKSGFKMIILPDGTTTGTVGGGAIEKRVKEDALHLMPRGTNSLIEYILSDKAEEGPNVAYAVQREIDCLFRNFRKKTKRLYIRSRTRWQRFNIPFKTSKLSYRSY